MARLSFEPRLTQAGNSVPPCTFHPLLVVLVHAMAGAMKTPAEAAHLITMASQYVSEQLPLRRKEELERSSPTKDKWTRLRFRFTRRDLKVLKEAAWSQVTQPPPVGLAMRDLISAVDMVLGELNAAHERALPLGDEEKEASKVEALPDLDLPDDEPSSGTPKNVDYDELISR